MIKSNMILLALVASFTMGVQGAQRSSKPEELGEKMVSNAMAGSLDLGVLEELVEFKLEKSFSQVLLNEITELAFHEGVTPDYSWGDFPSKAIRFIADLSGDYIPREIFSRFADGIYQPSREISPLGKVANDPKAVSYLCKLVCDSLNQFLKDPSSLRADRLVQKLRFAKTVFLYDPGSPQRETKLDPLWAYHQKNAQNFYVGDYHDLSGYLYDNNMDFFDLEIFQFVQRRKAGGVQNVYLKAIDQVLSGVSQ